MCVMYYGVRYGIASRPIYCIYLILLVDLMANFHVCNVLRGTLWYSQSSHLLHIPNSIGGFDGKFPCVECTTGYVMVLPVVPFTAHIANSIGQQSMIFPYISVNYALILL